MKTTSLSEQYFAHLHEKFVAIADAPGKDTMAGSTVWTSKASKLLNTILAVEHSTVILVWNFSMPRGLTNRLRKLRTDASKGLLSFTT